MQFRTATVLQIAKARSGHLVTIVAHCPFGQRRLTSDDRRTRSLIPNPFLLGQERTLLSQGGVAKGPLFNQNDQAGQAQPITSNHQAYVLHGYVKCFPLTSIEPQIWRGHRKLGTHYNERSEKRLCASQRRLEPAI
jgi:hypothetical protein